MKSRWDGGYRTDRNLLNEHPLATMYPLCDRERSPVGSKNKTDPRCMEAHRVPRGARWSTLPRESTPAIPESSSTDQVSIRLFRLALEHSPELLHPHLPRVHGLARPQHY